MQVLLLISCLATDSCIAYEDVGGGVVVAVVVVIVIVVVVVVVVVVAVDFGSRV